MTRLVLDLNSLLFDQRRGTDRIVVGLFVAARGPLAECGRVLHLSGNRRSASGSPRDLRAVVAMRFHLAGIALASAVAATAIAQSPVQPPAVINPVGTWRGSSVCLVRPSAFNDEVVVYRITPMKAPDSLAVDARKIIGGEEQEMGVLGCRLMPLSGQLTCTIRQGVWHFRVRKDSLTGEFRQLDNTRYREVRTIRAP
jgi:hypothetical protein